MTVLNYLDKMRSIQRSLLEYIEETPKSNEKFLALNKILDEGSIKTNIHELKSVLYLILKIANNHHRTPDFTSKIIDILQLFKNEIKENFSHFTIFNLFKSNKRILLFLIEEGIITINKEISKIILGPKYLELKYPQYFFNEVKSFLEDDLKEISNEIPADFAEKRRIGENDDHICQLIRNDSIDGFISFTTSNKISLKEKIKPSIFETNFFLLKNEPTLIEYAAFFNSIKIFRFIYEKNNELPSSLWIYAIHGNSPEIIKILENHQSRPDDFDYEKFIDESIKCHHIKLKNHIHKKFLTATKEYAYEIFLQSLKYSNFAFIQSKLINQSVFFLLCKYGYYPLVEILLNNQQIDVNLKTTVFLHSL